MKANADILESNDVVSGNGKLSSYSRKAQRLEMNAKNDTESKVLDLSAGDDAITKLFKESFKNSSVFVSLLQGANDQDRKNADALVLNAAKMYELEPNTENKEDYMAALRMQKNLLLKRSLLQTSAVKEKSGSNQEDTPNFHVSDDDGYQFFSNFTSSSANSSS